VIRDILHRLRERFPRKVLVWPVAVQGQNCATEVARAIRGFNALAPGGALPRPDLLIVARGGGSVEDLWGFNEEIVVRAAAESAIPLISAVGHETDTTLIDYAADKRAPTPTAAAELAVPVRRDLLAWIEGQGARLAHAQGQAIGLREQRLRDLARALPRPETLLDGARQRLDTWGERLPAALIRSVQIRRVRLSDSAGALRPALLRRAAEGDRRRLTATVARLNIAALRREIAQKGRDLDRLSQRFAEAGRRDLAARRDRLGALDRLRETLGYRATLARGYAVVRAGGVLVTTRAAAVGARALEIEFADGTLAVGDAPAPRKPGKPKTPPEGQGSLFSSDRSDKS
jgi:exodeoxyribonuclease VII large subunit